MRLRSTYSIRWQRHGEAEVYECHGLTARLIVRRIRGLIETTGRPAIIHGIWREPERNLVERGSGQC